ncbi:MAG: four helix bundle protein [Sphingomonadales bacterium]|jgi:four helix bundle protein
MEKMSYKSKSVVLKKAFNFAVSIVKLNETLNEAKQFVLAKQLIRSGTSIGANINEALAGYSKRDFMFKMSLALKESNETEYWLLLLKESKTIDMNFDSFIDEITELQRMLTAILNTTKRRMQAA